MNLHKAGRAQWNPVCLSACLLNNSLNWLVSFFLGFLLHGIKEWWCLKLKEPDFRAEIIVWQFWVIYTQNNLKTKFLLNFKNFGLQFLISLNEISYGARLFFYVFFICSLAAPRPTYRGYSLTDSILITVCHNL